MNVSKWIEEQDAIPRPRCTICRHPRAEEIASATREFVEANNERDNPISISRFCERGLAVEFGLKATNATILKHLRGCLKLDV